MTRIDDLTRDRRFSAAIAKAHKPPALRKRVIRADRTKRRPAPVTLAKTAAYDPEEADPCLTP